MSKDLFRPLKNLTTKIGSGATPRGGQANYKKEGISLIRSQNVLDMSFSKDGLAYIDEEQAKKLINVEVFSNDILLNITGDSIARVCKVPNEVLPARVNQHVSILRSNHLLDPDYLLYYLIYKKDYLLTISRVGGTRNALTKEAIENLEIRVDKNQQKIASVLSALDDKIELNNKINAELEAMAKTMYDYWFVQFDFSFDFAQDKPNAEGKPYKSSGGKMVFNETLKREIPEGWEVKTIGDYCKSTGGFAFKSSWWSDKGLAVVKIKDIQEDNTISLNDLSYADIPSDKIGVNFLAKPGNVLIAMTGATVGKFAIVPYTNEQLFVNQRVGYFNLGENPMDKLPFLINSLNQKYFREAIFTLASGAAQPNISNEQINNIALLLPKKELILKFNSSLSSYYSKILNNQKENQELASLRDWLLPMLMNGQVSVE